MKFIKKLPTTNKELKDKLLSNGWKRLREPSNIGIAILLSIPFMLINGFIYMVLVFYLYPPFKKFIVTKNADGISIEIGLLILLIYLVISYLFFILHEFLHASFIPNVLKSDKTCWGLNAFFGFVYTTEEITKRRFLIISIAPFILLSFILPFILSILGLLNGFILFLGLLNAMGSCVDCLNICIVATQVPNGSYITSNGSETYFKQLQSEKNYRVENKAPGKNVE